MIRCGMIGRAESTGLSAMSRDAALNLPINDVVIVDVHHPQPMDLTPFPGAPVADPTTPAFETAVKAMLPRIDTLLVLETPYDPRVYDWAREADVMTVCVAMPEYDIPERWGADIIVNPTDYLHDRLPPGAIVFPWPVDTASVIFRARTEARTFLHIVGQPCAQDRNGTKLVIDAFRAMPDRRLIVRSQVSVVKGVKHAKNIEYRVGNPTLEELYDDGDVLVYPRRYAGQSLVMQEAQAAGLPLVCLDREPDRGWTLSPALIPAHVKNTWPVVRNSQRDVPGTGIKTDYSPVDVYDAKISDVIATIERVASNPFVVESLSNFSHSRASHMSWGALRGEWVKILSGSCPSL